MNEARFAALESSVKRIESAICGDPEMKIKGIAQKVEDHDEYIESDRRLKWTISGAASAIGTLIGALIGYNSR